MSKSHGVHCTCGSGAQQYIEQLEEQLEDRTNQYWECSARWSKVSKQAEKLQAEADEDAENRRVVALAVDHIRAEKENIKQLRAGLRHYAFTHNDGSRNLAQRTLDGETQDDS